MLGLCDIQHKADHALRTTVQIALCHHPSVMYPEIVSVTAAQAVFGLIARRLALQMILQQIVHAAETGMLEPDRFFESLRSLAVQFGRDPNLAGRPESTKLADLGLLGEYLEDLPYQSDVMSIDQDTWTHWGPQRQLAFTNRLKSKIRLYERYNADWRRWVNLAQTSAAGLSRALVRAEGSRTGTISHSYPDRFR